MSPGRPQARPRPTKVRRRSPAPNSPHSAAPENGLERQPESSQMEQLKAKSRLHHWRWSSQDKSHECLVSQNQLELCFHPKCSEGAAAARGSQPLIRNGNYYYWEVTVMEKAYGTSIMFGLCTKRQPLYLRDYCNLVGLDNQGWSLSHRGLTWHNGALTRYTQEFPLNQSVTIGLLFNTMRGELSYFMDGKNLGVAFRGLNEINDDLYPVVGSTARFTRMRLDGAYCGYISLLERLLSCVHDHNKLVQYLKDNQVPKQLLDYLATQAVLSCDNQKETSNTINATEVSDWS